MEIKKMWAIVQTVHNNRITVKFDNGEVSSKQYRYPKGSNPSIGDRAFFIDDICIGIY